MKKLLFLVLVVVGLVSITACNNLLNIPSTAVPGPAPVPTVCSSGCCVPVAPVFQSAVTTSLYPYGIAVSPITGNLYVTELSGCYCSPKPSHGGGSIPKGSDISSSSIGRLLEEFDSRGNLMTSWTFNLSTPLGVAISPVTGDVYVADYNNGIVQYTANGQWVRTWRNFTWKGNHYTIESYGLTFAQDGNILVADYNNYAVETFSPNGQIVGFFRPSNTIQPISIAEGPNGDLFGFDNYSYRTQEYSNGGTLLKNLSTYGGSCGQVGHGYGVAVRTDRTVFVADLWYGSVDVFDAMGNFVGKWNDGSRLSEPFGIAIKADGTIYVADEGGNNKVYKYR